MWKTRHLSSSGEYFFGLSSGLLGLWGQQGDERRASLPQVLNISGIVVGDAVFPAPKQNTNRLECEGSHGGVMGFATLSLQVVERFGPLAVRDRVPGELVEGLAKEYGGRPAPVCPRCLSALLGDRGNAAELLEVFAAGITRAVSPERDHEVRAHDRPGVGKTVEEAFFGMAGIERRDFFVMLVYVRLQSQELFAETADQKNGGVNMATSVTNVARQS